jgi:hypothetical protein
MFLLDRLKSFLASTGTGSDLRSVTLAFSLVPFFAGLKLWLLIWGDIDGGSDSVANLGAHQVVLFLGADLLLCLALAGAYFLIGLLRHVPLGRHFPALAAIFAIHCAVALFTVVSLKVSQIYGSPLTVLHLRMADDISVMRGSIMSYVDLAGVIMVALGIACFWLAAVVCANGAAGWRPMRWRLWTGLTVACVAVAAVSYGQLQGVYTYGLKKNAIVNFIIYYEPLPGDRDFKAMAERLHASAPPNVDWHAPMRTEASAPYRGPDLTGLARGKNLVLIVLESTAAAYIDAETTPNLHRLRQHAVEFPSYFTTAVNSFQSNYSIFYSDHVGDISRIGHPWARCCRDQATARDCSSRESSPTPTSATCGATKASTSSMARNPSCARPGRADGSGAHMNPRPSV